MPPASVTPRAPREMDSNPDVGPVPLAPLGTGDPIELARSTSRAPLYYEEVIVVQRTRYLAPQEVDLEPEPDEDLEEEEVWLENPVIGAEELLRFSRVRELLQA